MPPEIINNVLKCGTYSDIWSLGCILYDMIYGKPPFFDKTDYLVFENINNLHFKYPEDIVASDDVKDLISNILRINPFERLTGNGDFKMLKNHSFFIDFESCKIFSDLKKLKAGKIKAQPISKTLSGIPENIIVNQEFTKPLALKKLYSIHISPSTYFSKYGIFYKHTNLEKKLYNTLIRNDNNNYNTKMPKNAEIVENVKGLSYKYEHQNQDQVEDEGSEADFESQCLDFKVSQHMFVNDLAKKFDFLRCSIEKSQS